jgi:peroxiredoxin
MRPAQPAGHERPEAARRHREGPARPDAPRSSSEALPGIIAPGTPAPEFRLVREDGEPFTREDLLGRTTVLVFYPFAFSPVCTDQLNLYEEVLDDLRERGATLYGVSCDATWSQTAFREKLGVTIEQLSDFEPKGETCRAFGVLHPGGFPQRALVLVGPDRIVRWSYQAESPGDLPGANLIFDALAA